MNAEYDEDFDIEAPEDGPTEAEEEEEVDEVKTDPVDD